MSDCPNCGSDLDRPWWAPGACRCGYEPDGDILDIAEKFDYITPASETFGVNKYLVFVLALFLIAGVFASHGVLWG
jgi:hypothetical protein